MDAKLQKSLTDLIDETLGELEELRKSRFAAAEISLAGPGDTKMGGQEANGKLGKDEDKKDDEDEDKKDKDMDKGENRKADPDGGHHKPVAGEGMEHGQGPDKSRHGSESRGSEGKNSEADPGEIGPVGKADKDEDKDKKKDKKDAPQPDEKGHEEEEKKIASKLMAMHKDEMKKSMDETESLMKSYVETRVKPLEDKLTTILELVNKIAEQPVAPKGVTARGGQPLFKSEDAGGEPLSKAEIASKLFELKKSGSKVDSLDIAKAEMGQELGSLTKKYQLS